MLENTCYVVSTKVQSKLVGMVRNELTVLLVHSQIFYFNGGRILSISLSYILCADKCNSFV